MGEAHGQWCQADELAKLLASDGAAYDFFGNSVVISGDWAVSGAVNHKPNFWYVHAPMREVWDLYQYIRQNNVPWLGRWAFDIWAKYNRYLVRKYIKKVDTIVCNSVNTQN